MIKRLLVASVVLVAALVAIPAPAALAAGADPVVVTPGALGDWEVDLTPCDGEGGSLEFVAGPSPVPLGGGSAQLWTGRNPMTRPSLLLRSLAGITLPEIGALSYDAIVQAGERAPYAQFKLDLDRDGTADETWTFEPPASPEWTTHNALDGAWRLEGEGELSWHELAESRGDAVIDEHGLRLAIGCSDESWKNVVANVDAVNIESSTVVALFDFEPGASGLTIDEVAVDEGDNGDLTVSMASPLPDAVRFSVEFTTDPAGEVEIAPGEYLIPAGDTSTVVPFTTTEDGLDEDDEVFAVLLASDDAPVDDPDGSITVTDDDEMPTLRATTLETVEGATGPQQMTVEVELTEASGRDVEFTYLTTQTSTVEFALTAREGIDFAAVSGNGTIPAGGTTTSFLVPIYGDRIVELDETFDVRLESTTATAEWAFPQIVDDDRGPAAVRIADASSIEGDQLRIELTRTGDVSEAVQVTAATAAGPAPSASAGEYTALSTPVVFSPGQTMADLFIDLAEDASDEPNEHFAVNLSAPVNAVITDAQGVATIIDDEGASIPYLTSWLAVDDTQIQEGTGAGTKNAAVAVLRTGDVSGPASATATAVAGSANVPGDVNATTVAVSFAAGESFAVVQMPVVMDSVRERPETFTVELSSAVGATVADASGQVTILDDEANVPPSFAIWDTSVTEGNAGSAVAAFTVRRNGLGTEAASVRWNTAAGTAPIAATTDYTPVTTPQTLTFAPGEFERVINVNVTGDTVDEANEHFSVVLSSPVNAGLGDAVGLGMIVDDDGAITPPPATYFAAMEATPVVEGAQAVVRVVRRGDTSGTGSVQFKSINGTAAEPGDFTVVAAATVVFNPGQTQRNIPIPTLNDTVPEWPEQLTIKLNAPVNGTIEDNEGAVLILDDDTGINISVTGPTPIDETDAPTSAQVDFGLSAPSDQPVTFTVATVNGTATAGADFTAVNQVVTFDPGETSASITIPISGDNVDESDETFTIALTNVAGAAPPATLPTITIADDDSSGVFVWDAVVNEAAGQALVDVTLTEPVGSVVNVTMKTMGSTAQAGIDFTHTETVLQFQPGETAKTFVVPILQDTIYESGEAFLAFVFGAGGQPLARGSGVVWLEDDDPAPVVSIRDAVASEDNGTIEFIVDKVGTSSGTVVVKAYSFNATATRGTDFSHTSSSIIVAGDASGTFVTVPLVDELTCESTEFFTVELLVEGATIGDGVGKGVITDIDCGGMTIHDAWADESAGVATLAVTIPDALSFRSSASFATAAGTAGAPGDYTHTTGVVKFPAGVKAKNITVPLVNNSGTCESPETFTVTLSAVTNQTLVRSTATVTIADSNCLGISVIDPPVPANEGAPVQFVVALSNVSPTTVAFDMNTSDGTAVVGADYTAAAGHFEFAPGTRFIPVPVPTVATSACEADETVNLNITAGFAAPVAKPLATGVIHDTSGICLSINDRTATEGSNATFTIAAFPTPTAAFSVTATTEDHNAIATGDYTHKAQTITFGVGESAKSFTVSTIDTGQSGGCEGPEVFRVRLSAPTGSAVISDATGDGTITDFGSDCAATGLAMVNTTVLETIGNATVNVTLSSPATAATTVSWTTVTGTATAPNDYVHTTGSVLFNVGESSKNLGVQVVDSAGCEPNEVFMVRITSTSPATPVMDGWATIIIDDIDC